MLRNFKNNIDDNKNKATYVKDKLKSKNDIHSIFLAYLHAFLSIDQSVNQALKIYFVEIDIKNVFSEFTKYMMIHIP